MLREQYLYNVLLRLVVSEKSTRLSAQEYQVVFYVRNDSNKRDIAAAVKLAFDVEVKKVCIVNVKSRCKARRIGRSSRPSGVARQVVHKKAYICLGSEQSVKRIGEVYGLAQG